MGRASFVGAILFAVLGFIAGVCALSFGSAAPDLPTPLLLFLCPAAILGGLLFAGNAEPTSCGSSYSSIPRSTQFSATGSQNFFASIRNDHSEIFFDTRKRIVFPRL